MAELVYINKFDPGHVSDWLEDKVRSRKVIAAFAVVLEEGQSQPECSYAAFQARDVLWSLEQLKRRVIEL